MWMFFEDGTFYSAVTDKRDEDVKWVRSRDKRSADIFVKWLGGDAEVLSWDRVDYSYRVKTTSELWALYVDEKVRSAKATNFKNEVRKNGASERFLHALHDVWGVMWDYQFDLKHPEPKKAKGKKK